MRPRLLDADEMRRFREALDYVGVETYDGMTLQELRFALVSSGQRELADLADAGVTAEQTMDFVRRVESKRRRGGRR